MGDRIEITLEIEPESDPIVGLLRDGRGERHEFRGWVQLMAAVDGARSPEVAARSREGEERKAGPARDGGGG